MFTSTCVAFQFSDQVLNSHVIAQYHVKYELSCGMRCVVHNSCLSYNYQPISNLERNTLNCQLNNATRLTSPESYTRQPGRIYCEVVEVSMYLKTLQTRWRVGIAVRVCVVIRRRVLICEAVPHSIAKVV